jgi:alanine racemase
MNVVKAVISRSAIVHNYRIINNFAPNSKVISVLKANAYGHGLLEMARTLTESDAFGVARIEEALELRAGGIVKPIVLLEGFFEQSDIEILVTNNIQTVIHSLHQLAMLEQTPLAGQLKVWLKIDTGMNRLGITKEQFEEAYQRLQQVSYVVQPINFMSHFACADDLSNPFTNVQAQQFFQLVDGYQGELTLANSAAILAWPQTHVDWIRPGLLLYGCSAVNNRSAKEYGLRAAMTLSSSVIAIKPIFQGQKVGYGSTWQAPNDTELAVIAIGYGDGYPRHAKAGTPVLINGKRYPIVGRVSMDMITVDLGLGHQVNCGDSVILWGEDLPADEIAKWADTISYELLLQLTSRVSILFED